jgi:hypothetical protein
MLMGDCLKRTTSFAACAAAAFGLATAAHASTTFDTSLQDPPGVFFGTGNFNTHYAVDQGSGVEIGLKSKINRDPNDSVDPYGSSVYNIALGNKVSFDFAVIDNNDAGGADLAGATASITIRNLTQGLVSTFFVDPAHITDDTVWGGSYENSEQLGFFPVGFSLTTPAQYDITLTLSNLANGAQPLSVRNIVNYGAVPEPAAWGLMLLGFGAAGAGLRRRRASVARA